MCTIRRHGDRYRRGNRYMSLYNCSHGDQVGILETETKKSHEMQGSIKITNQKDWQGHSPSAKTVLDTNEMKPEAFLCETSCKNTSALVTGELELSSKSCCRAFYVKGKNELQAIRLVCYHWFHDLGRSSGNFKNGVKLADDRPWSLNLGKHTARMSRSQLLHLVHYWLYWISD